MKIKSALYTDVIVTRIDDKKKHQQHFTSVQPSRRLSKSRVSCRRFEEVTLQTGRCEESSLFMVLCLHLFAKYRTSYLRGVCEGVGVWMASSAGFSAHIRVGLFRTDSLSSGGGGGRKARKCETGVFQDIVILDGKRNANAAH